LNWQLARQARVGALFLFHRATVARAPKHLASLLNYSSLCAI